MQDALLGVAVFTALMAAGAFLVPLWQDRIQLALVFTSGHSSGPAGVAVRARVENNGRSTIHEVELYSGPPGLILDPQHRITSLSMPPFTHHDFPVSADGVSDPGGVTLNAPVLIIARYGRRMTVTEMPSGRYSSDRQKTATLKARGTVATWGKRRRFGIRR